LQILHAAQICITKCFASRVGLHPAQDADFGTWVIGIIAAAALLLSAVLAIFQFFLSITNNCGRHTAGLAFPMG
jgi:hypothetical protein